MKTVIRIATSSIGVVGAAAAAFGVMGYLPGWTIFAGTATVVAVYCLWG